MPLLDRLRGRSNSQQPPLASSPLRVLRADGQRVDLTARDAGTRLTLIRQDWQNDAWTYRDMIGELRFAQQLLSRSVAKVRFFAAELRDYPETPVELTGTGHHLDAALARDAVGNLARLPLDDGPDGFLATLTENLKTAGEAWIHGELDDIDGERWTVRSVSEITGAGDRVLVSELPGTMSQRPLDPDREQLLRCWVRHPRWGKLADSPLRSMLDVLEEVVLSGREMRAASRSRIASNGVLLLPTSLTLLRTRQDEEDPTNQGVDENDFMVDFTEALTAPIRNEGDPGAVVPLVLRGDAEALKEVRHLTLTRDDALKLMERLQGAVLRMLQGLDIQPEKVTGIGETNHWSGWQVEASDVRHQVIPTCGIVAGVLTKAFLRPALLSLGYPADQLRRVGVWYDPSSLVESPDRSQDARDAWDREAIKDSALRESLGFTEDDAPDASEHLVRLLSRGRLAPQAIPLIAALSGVKLDSPEVQRALAIAVGVNQNQSASPGVPRGLPAGTPHPATPDRVVPEQPVPSEPAPNDPTAGPVVAAGAPPVGWRVDVDTARQLTAIDASLAERILTASDAAIMRAVERAGGRVRNASRRDGAVAASITGVDAALVAATLGRDRVASFVSITDLLAGAYTKLRDQVDTWLDQAAQAVGDAVLQLLGVDPGSDRGRVVRGEVTTRYAVHRDAAWQMLSAALDIATERALFRADPFTPDAGPGEHAGSLVPPADVVGVLRVAGGGRPDDPGAGFGTGPVTQQTLTDAGGVVLGWEWQYHPEHPRASHFLPHQLLNGTRFVTWTDPKLDTDAATAWIGPVFHPQDHPGCRCGSSIVWALPEVGPGEDPEDIVASRIREAQRSPRGRLAGDIARQDTAAGRRGTSIQNEVETRDRVLAGVEQLRAHYIEGATQ